MKTPDPADAAQGDIHGARPVHAMGPPIPRDPIRYFVDELLRISLVAGQPVGLAQRGEVLAAAQLPWNLDVRRTIEFQVVEAWRVVHRPLPAGLEVGVPRQPRP